MRLQAVTLLLGICFIGQLEGCHRNVPKTPRPTPSENPPQVSAQTPVFSDEETKEKADGSKVADMALLEVPMNVEAPKAAELRLGERFGERLGGGRVPFNRRGRTQEDRNINRAREDNRRNRNRENNSSEEDTSEGSSEESISSEEVQETPSPPSEPSDPSGELEPLYRADGRRDRGYQPKGSGSPAKGDGGRRGQRREGESSEDDDSGASKESSTVAPLFIEPLAEFEPVDPLEPSEPLGDMDGEENERKNEGEEDSNESEEDSDESEKDGDEAEDGSHEGEIRPNRERSGKGGGRISGGKGKGIGSVGSGEVVEDMEGGGGKGKGFGRRRSGKGKGRGNGRGRGISRGELLPLCVIQDAATGSVTSSGTCPDERSCDVGPLQAEIEHMAVNLYFCNARNDTETEMVDMKICRAESPDGDVTESPCRGYQACTSGPHELSLSASDLVYTVWMCERQYNFQRIVMALVEGACSVLTPSGPVERLCTAGDCSRGPIILPQGGGIVSLSFCQEAVGDAALPDWIEVFNEAIMMARRDIPEESTTTTGEEEEEDFGGEFDGDYGGEFGAEAANEEMEPFESFKDV